MMKPLFFSVYFSFCLLGMPQQSVADEYDNALSAYFDYYEYEIARELFLHTARRGNDNAMFYLGEIYEGGVAVEQDFKKAFDWYLKAAEAKHADAKIRLAALFADGRGVTKDINMAHHWYLSAAEQGSPLSQFRVAQLYADIDVNYKSNNAIEAYKWWTIAASFGDPEALQARDRFAKKMDSADIMRGAELARKWELQH